MPVWDSTYNAKVAELQAALKEIRKKNEVISNLQEQHKADMKALKSKHKKMERWKATTMELETRLNGLQESADRKMEALKEIHKEKIALFSENEKKLLQKNSSLEKKFAELQKNNLEMKGVTAEQIQNILKVSNEYRKQLADKSVTLGKKNEELEDSNRRADIAEGFHKSLTVELQEERKRVEELRQQLVDVKADLKQTKSWFDAHVAQSGVNFARSVHNVLEQATSGKKRRIGEMRNMMQQVLMNQSSTGQTNAENTD